MTTHIEIVGGPEHSDWVWKPAWTSEGACTDYPLELFHSPTGSADEEQALEVCGACGFTDVCLEWTMEREEAGARGESKIYRSGIYGATTEFQRSRLYLEIIAADTADSEEPQPNPV